MTRVPSFAAAPCIAELFACEARSLFGAEEVHAGVRRVAAAEACEEGTLLLRIPAEDYLR